jgi:hypothetical protein
MFILNHPICTDAHIQKRNEISTFLVEMGRQREKFTPKHKLCTITVRESRSIATSQPVVTLVLQDWARCCRSTQGFCSDHS